MKLHYYPETDGPYAEFKTEPGVKTREVSDGLNVDLDSAGDVVGFDIVDLALFGSFARDSATAGSDIDIPVRFDGPATSKRYFGVQSYFEDLLGRSVDLMSDRALRRELRPYVEREAIHV